MMALAWAGCALVLLALLQSLFNTWRWPRGNTPTQRRSVSVLIPARNEERNIARAVRSAALEAEAGRIVVCDDNSTDATPRVLQRLQDDIPQLHTFRASPLPAGWVGKVHACHQLAQRETSEILVFMDADAAFLPGGLGRLLSLFDTHQASLVTAVPRQETETLAERLIIPLLHLTYTSWLPLPLIWRSRNPRFLAANGQLLAIRRDTLEALGGFEAIRGEVVDDMALCRRAKQAGHRVVFGDGHHMATCRMYRSGREVWEGFSKNIYEGLGGSWLGLAGICALYSVAFVLPYPLFALALGSTEAFLLPAGIAVLGNLSVRGLLAWRHQQCTSSVLWHPVGVLMLLAIAVNSMRWSRRGAVRWRGRVYASRGARDGRMAVEEAHPGDDTGDLPTPKPVKLPAQG
jgi:chlorobactene glucosyltransferase